MDRYDYKQLEARALAADATAADLNALGEWFDQYGSQFWNGEVYDIDGAHGLKPVYAIYTVRDREAGNEIEFCQTEAEAKEILAQFEATDKAEGTYEPDFYEVAELDDPKRIGWELV